MTAHQLLAVGWLELILAEIATVYDPASRTGKKIASHVAWMLRYFQLRSITVWSEVTAAITSEWYWAATRRPDGTPVDPSVNTARNRRWMACLAFEAAAKLGAQIDPAAAAGKKIQQPSDIDASPRPLDDDEDERICAFGDPGGLPTKRSVVVAASRAGASVEDLINLRAADVNLDAATIRFSGKTERLCDLDAKSVKIIARYLDANPDTAPDDLLCVKSTTAPERARESVHTQLCNVIREAGFAHHPDIAGRSLRLTAARRAFERDGIEAAARLLGSPSLDGTARSIDHDWQHQDFTEPLGHGRRTATGEPDAVGDRDG